MRYSKVFGPFSLGANCGMAKQLGHRELDSQLLEQLRFEMCEQKRIAAGIEKIDVDGSRLQFQQRSPDTSYAAFQLRCRRRGNERRRRIGFW